MTKGSKISNGARTKLRLFFLNHVGEVLEAEQLRTVAGGISEWARRIRELRTEEGYQILTHNDRADLKPGQYLLETPKPQPAFAREISKETRAYVNASKLSKGPSGSLLFVQCRLDQLSFGHRGQAIANAAARVPERYP